VRHGGAVLAVISRRADDVLGEIMREYEKQTGARPELFDGSSPAHGHVGTGVFGEIGSKRNGENRSPARDSSQGILKRAVSSFECEWLSIPDWGLWETRRMVTEVTTRKNRMRLKDFNIPISGRVTAPPESPPLRAEVRLRPTSEPPPPKSPRRSPSGRRRRIAAVTPTRSEASPSPFSWYGLRVGSGWAGVRRECAGSGGRGRSWGYCVPRVYR